MTEAQLEDAARAYCHEMGLDPDELVGHGAGPNAQGNVPAIYMESARWRLVVPQVKAHAAMSKAIHETMKGEKEHGG